MNDFLHFLTSLTLEGAWIVIQMLPFRWRVDSSSVPLVTPL